MAEEQKQSQTQAAAGAVLKRLAQQAVRKIGAAFGGWGILVSEVVGRFWKIIVAGGVALFIIPFLIILFVLLAILGGGLDPTQAQPRTEICSTIPTTMTGAHVSLINGNVEIYKEAAKQADIPWEVLAAIHYEEHGSSRVTPQFQTADGVYQIVGAGYPYPAGHILTDAEFLKQSIDAAKFVQNKATNSNTPGLAEPLRQNMNPADAQDQANIKDAFWGYNGRADYMRDIAESLGYDPVDEGYEGSFYVMNNWDAVRVKMDRRFINKEGELVIVKMINDGTWKVFIILRSATYDADGKIVRLNDVCILEGGDSTDTPVGCPVAHGKVGGNLYNPPSHNGIDMSNVGGLDGNRVRVTHTGIVTWVSKEEHIRAGYFVEVQNITYRTRYLHLLPSISVTVGQKVVRGDVLGIEDDTGESYGSHLHYEVYKDKVVMDPTAFIPMPNESEAECKASN